MSDNTYHRWVTFVGAGEPAWAAARAHLSALASQNIREENGAPLEWAVIDEVLGLPEICDDVVEEIAAVRAQLAEDLADLQAFWSSGHATVTDETHPGGRTLMAGGELGPDWEYPSAATGCLARLIGTGTARAAGFHADEDGVDDAPIAPDHEPE